MEPNSPPLQISEKWHQYSVVRKGKWKQLEHDASFMRFSTLKVRSLSSLVSLFGRNHSRRLVVYVTGSCSDPFPLHSTRPVLWRITSRTTFVLFILKLSYDLSSNLIYLVYSCLMFTLCLLKQVLTYPYFSPAETSHGLCISSSTHKLALLKSFIHNTKRLKHVHFVFCFSILNTMSALLKK
jgi:hypothetical protein